MNKNSSKIAKDILKLIGYTPLIRLNKIRAPQDADILAKLEWFNPSGSVKDRPALAMVEAAEKAGKLSKNKIILEATSGNTGIALAMIAAVKGYRLTIIMPESVSVERRRIIRAYGAKLILSSGKKGTGGAIELKQKLLAKYPSKFLDINQFKDPANIQAHYSTTAEEILAQTKGKFDVIVVGIGTGGTGSGISQKIKEILPDVKVIGVYPKLDVSIQGLRNPKAPFPTHLFDPNAFDEIVEIAKADLPKIYNVAHRLATQEGLLVGISSATVAYVALKFAKKLGTGKRIIVLFPDSGLKYLTTPVWNIRTRRNPKRGWR